MLGLVAMGALSACSGLGGKQTSTLPTENKSSQANHVAQAVVHRQYVAPEIRAAASRGDLAAFATVTNATRTGSLPSGTRLYRINTPGSCIASTGPVRSCYAVIPVLPGKSAPVDVSRALATYVVP